MKTKIQIKSISGDVKFEYECEYNSIKKTVEKAIKEICNLSGCDLSGCDLSGCDLSYSNLSGCDLSGCDLSGCDLSGCNLSGCNIRGSNLRGCNLSGSNLSGCDLSYSDLSGCKNKETAYLPLFCRWNFSIKGDKIVIGCKEKTIEEWDSWFSSTKTYSTERGTENFKQIEAVYLACKAYLQHLNK